MGIVAKYINMDTIVIVERNQNGGWRSFGRKGITDLERCTPNVTAEIEIASVKNVFARPSIT